MHLSRWKRWLLLSGLVLLGSYPALAQFSQRTVPELDRLPAWYPLYRQSAEFLETFPPAPTAPTQYTDLGDLLRKAGAGSKIESLVINGETLKQGGLPGLRQLQTVRVLNLNGLTQQQADSVFDAIQGWPLLERLSVNLYQTGPDKATSGGFETLPERVQRLPKLHDVRIAVTGAVPWNESVRVLSGLKTLRSLDVSNWGGTRPQPLDLGPLRQLTGLRIHGAGWLIKPETFAGLSQLTELSLTNTQVDTSTFARSLAGLPGLETLTISNLQKLRTVSLAGLKNLKSLELTYNNDLTIDAALFAGLPGLERLVVQSVHPIELAGLCPLTNLRTLILTGNGATNELHRLPDCIGQLAQLTELRLFSMALDQLPARIGSLTRLKHLALLACGLDSLPASFGQLTALEDLYLSNNKLKQLPALGQLRALQRLNVSGNQLTALPDDIVQLTQLTLLAVDQNKLTQLPASVTRLVNLRSLSVSNNQLERLPEELGNLRKLNSLTLEDNGLTALPTSLGGLDSLRNLIIGKNRLRTIPANVMRWKSLTNLSIGANELTALPNDIGLLRQLTTLSISANPITELPASVAELSNLQSLRIDGTRIRLLPDNIGALAKLRHVSLSNNELIALPNSIGQWQEVTSISLEQNNMQGLPNAIGRLTKLATLSISGKEKAMEGATGGLQQLPDSIVYCTRLRQLSIRQQPQVDANDVFAKAVRLKGLTNLTVTNCNIHQLPGIAWKDVTWQRLDVSGNLLTELPVAILDAPKLQSLGAYENRLPDPLNRSFQDKDALRVAFVEAGMLQPGSLGKPNRKIGMAYQQMASQKARQRDWEGAMNDLQKAIDFTPDTTLALPYAQRAELHFFRKEYKEALADYDKAIAYAPQLHKETHEDPLMANRTLTTFWERKARIFGTMANVDEALKAITQAESLLPALDNSPMSGQVYTERGRYLTLKGKPADADSSYSRAIRAYEQLRYAQPGILLTVVELGVLTGQYDRAQRALDNLPAEQLQGGYEVLKEYLETCLAVLKRGQSTSQATERLTAYLAKHPAKIYGWSFDLFDNWLNKTKLPAETITALHQLTDITKERLIKPQ